ncbi:enoyl-ACP reductase FabV [Spirochaeta thermophila]|uniref:Trans-2-enoyl-CoA reductase [NADH] n=1 Tax=Winmispira thermophila (strain ATCC 49972 / DSM 6192 / RI 19.B1) TaxID=665571 RepID=E0RNH9_WINT6|nr:enoyl-ACP reductase FabV [Spirochaeta thermophila]QEG96750.1 St_Ter [Expression vector BT10]QEG96756.1 St_Ter [Expression vector BT11]QEG96762.1 St_Ter [Expression vector BT12]QEG96776.1 St_Ter [Expression vector pLT_199]QEG96781.1 St_Ter [Expression vector pLT_228]QFX78140.1 St_Ter [Expression vector BT04]QFX78146.1 St_Ter [Expression vector BT05]QFX78152.1 St_Ter [Expression vector BT06]
MVIKPMIRNNICMNAHPEGCRLFVDRQIDYVRQRGPLSSGPKNVLVVGSSGGYGLATRIAAGFGAGAATIGVYFEKEPSEKRTGTPGWYAARHFLKRAEAAGLKVHDINGDAFSFEVKEQVVDLIKKEYGTIDLFVYSLASGVRTDPVSGVTYRSALKPIGRTYTSKALDPLKREVIQATIEPASEEEIEATVKVMGGEDWQLWVEALKEGGVLAEGAVTVAYSYIGPELTRPIYREGTIGKAKEHLEATAKTLDEALASVGGKAYVSVNKAVVTRASAVIPAVPLYLSILFTVMKAKGIHEGCIEQMYRMLAERLYAGGPVPVDDEGRIRMDDWEMREDVQREVAEVWERITTETLDREADVDGYLTDFLNLHGFGFKEIDYEKEVDPREG